jgi:GNAT superfamily N-acetyltransferase
LILLRPGTEADTDDVARIWYTGWCDGHLGRVPQELVGFRSAESFAKRAATRVRDATVAVVDGLVAGFVMVAGDEVEQLYVAREYRGTGVAQQLLAEAEGQVARNGFAQAWLAVVPENARARTFYARAGWVDQGAFHYEAATEAGPILVPSHRYTKRVSRSVPPA